MTHAKHPFHAQYDYLENLIYKQPLHHQYGTEQLMIVHLSANRQSTLVLPIKARRRHYHTKTVITRKHIREIRYDPTDRMTDPTTPGHSGGQSSAP